MEVARTGRLLVGAAALTAALLAPSCPSPSRQEASALLTTDGGPLHLLDHLDAARIEVAHPSDLERQFGAPGPGDLLLSEPFDGGCAPVWFDRAFAEANFAAAPPATGAAQIARVALPIERRDGRGVAVVAPAGNTLACVVPAPPEATLLVTARVKALGRLPGAVSLVATSLELAPPTDPDPGLKQWKELLGRAAWVLAQPWSEKPVALAAETGDPAGARTAWRELTVVVPPLSDRKSLFLSLVAGPDGALVDAVEVRRLTPAERLALQPGPAPVGRTHPLRHVIEAPLEQWDCLTLPAPGSVAFRLRVPAKQPRLELATAVLTAQPDHRLDLEVTVDGRLIAAREGAAAVPATAKDTVRRVPYSGFSDWTIDLAAFAGQEVLLTFSAAGPAEDVALFGAPTLLGTPDAEPTSLLLVSLDTLRADHVGCYGAAGARTPRIDGLAGAGIRFARVLAPASWTLPTHVSMLSGQHPLVHETFGSTQPVDPERTLLLGRRLREAGFCTAAFTGGTLVHPRYGFGVGFDSYSMQDPGGVVGSHRRIGDEPDQDAAPGEDRMDRVVDWLTRHADQPFFLFVHTYLVHNYRPTADFLTAVGGGSVATREEVAALRVQAEAGDAAAVARLHALYRGTVAQADARIVGRLIDALAALHLSESTLVAVVADHGEEFFEHGGVGHGRHLGSEVTFVPWVLRGPGVPMGGVRDDVVELADVASTLAARLRLDADPRDLGHDQLTTLSDAGEARPHLLALREVAGTDDQDALLLWPWKLTRRLQKDGTVEHHLYDLLHDPLEAIDLSEREPARRARLIDQLEASQRELAAQKAALPSSGPQSMELPPELRRMLQAQGYGDR